MMDIYSYDLEFEKLSDVKVLVTGGSGYIGRNLVNRLIELRCQVSVVTRKKQLSKTSFHNLNYIELDLCNINKDIRKLSNYDVIFNCAGELKKEDKMYDLHVEGTMKLLKIVSRNPVRWVQLSSVGVYGQELNGEIKESNTFNPQGCYEQTKALAELKLRDYCKIHGIAYSILRPSNVFSVDMVNRSMLKYITLIRKELFLESNIKNDVYSNYVHIQNVVDSLLLCGFHKNTKNEDFIISDTLRQKDFVSIVSDFFEVKPRAYKYPYDFTIKVATLFAKITGKNFFVRVIRSLNSCAYYSNQKLMSATGYSNTFSLKEGLREYMSFLKRTESK